MNIIHIETVTSTNSYLKELAHKQMLEEGTIIVAGNQTEGRGQKGNSWESEAGKNINCSIILYPSFLPIHRCFILSEVISLGVKETLDTYIEDITIKWPNDVNYKEKKIAGILIENELIGEKLSISVAGIGININQEQFLSDAHNPVSLKQITGREWDLDALLKELIQNILYRYEQLKGGEIETITKMYHSALYRKTGFHRYEDEKGIFNAQIDRVSDDGFLHFTTDEDEERSYTFKNVRFI